MKLQFENNEYYLMKDGEELAIATTDQSFIDELGAMKLSKQNCDEIFGVIDVEKLADEYIVIKPKHREHEHNLAVSAYIEGFNKAMELNKDKLFTLEEVMQAFIACWKANVPDGIECKVSFNDWFKQFEKK
jgi:hypothetical protein